MKKNNNDKLQPLFIDDLGEVKGGCGGSVTTLAIGEEDGGGVTTLAIGEEDGGWGGGGDATTLAIGEEDGGATTLALGEE